MMLLSTYKLANLPVFWQMHCVRYYKLVTQEWQRKCSQHFPNANMLACNKMVVYVHHDNVPCLLTCEGDMRYPAGYG